MKDKEFTSCFVGIPLPEEFQDEFKSFLRKINQIDPDIETTFREAPHITLYYLDKQSQNHLVEVEEIVKQYISLLKGVSLKIGGIDTFGGDNPRVLFLPVVYPDVLKEFNKVLSKNLKKFVTFDDELLFHPHMTVARFTEKSQATWENNRTAVEQAMKKIDWQFTVIEVIIYGVDSTKTPQYQEKLITIPISY